MSNCAESSETVYMKWIPQTRDDETSKMFHFVALNSTRWYFRRRIDEQGTLCCYLYRYRDEGPDTIAIDLKIQVESYFISSQFSFTKNSYNKINAPVVLGSSIECGMRLSSADTLPQLQLLPNRQVCKVSKKLTVSSVMLQSERWEANFNILLSESFTGSTALLVTLRPDYNFRVKALYNTPIETICVLGMMSQVLNSDGSCAKPGIVFSTLGPSETEVEVTLKQAHIQRSPFSEDVILECEFYVTNFYNLIQLITMETCKFLRNKSSTTQAQDSPRKDSPLKSVAPDLGSSNQEGTVKDIILKVEEQTFQVHRAILCGRSPVFRALLDTNKEEERNAVTIPDLEASTVKMMLKYMYTGMVDLEFESAMKLYYAGDRYEIPSLKKACSDFLKFFLCPSNACEVLVLSESHKDEDLKLFVRNFIYGRSSEIFLSEAWKDIVTTKPQLAAETMQQFFIQEKHLSNLRSFINEFI